MEFLIKKRKSKSFKYSVNDKTCILGPQVSDSNKILLCLICASCLPFLLTLQGDFVFDDFEAILNNNDVYSESWVNLFNNDFWGTNIKSNFSHKSYRPLTILSFRFNYLLNNKTLSAVQFKITNVLCHVICCLLVWKSYVTILKDVFTEHQKKVVNTAFFAALLFALHPIHVEAVCGVVGRADILAAITFFLAFLVYRKAMSSTTNEYLLLTITLAGVSMLFKENGVTVLGFCLCYELVTKVKKRKYINRNNKMTHMNVQSLIRIMLVSLGIILLLYGRLAVMGGTKPEFKPTDNPAAFSESLFTKVATYNYIYFLNLLLLMWPQWLCYDWSMGCIPLIENVQDFRIIFAISIYMYAGLIVLALLKKTNKGSTKRLIVLAISLIVIPFSPAANIAYPVGFVIAERILYIPSAGYCFLIAIGLSKIMQRDEKRYKIYIMLFSFLMTIYGFRSWQRSYDWQNEYKLYISGLSVCPLNAKVHFNVAKVADAAQEKDWALEAYKESIRLYPDYYQALNNYANLLRAKNEFAVAEHYLRTAVNLKKDFPAAWMNLGIVLAGLKRYEESQLAYKTALQHRKHYPDCMYNLGNLYLEIGQTQAALECWTQAIQLNETHNLAWTNLLALLDNTEQFEKALEVIPKALKGLPDSPSINFAVANIYGKLDNFEDAERYFMKAIDLFGSKVKAVHYTNLGVLYHRRKNYNLAEKMYRNAIKIDPTFENANINLKSLERIKNQQ